MRILLLFNSTSQNIFPAYFSMGEYNIITIDYHCYASSMKCYSIAVQNLPIIAKCITQFLNAFLNEYLNFQFVHVIGFSLGTQITGVMAKLLKENKKILNRITGKKKIIFFLKYRSW